MRASARLIAPPSGTRRAGCPLDIQGRRDHGRPPQVFREAARDESDYADRPLPPDQQRGGEAGLSAVRPPGAPNGFLARLEPQLAPRLGHRGSRDSRRSRFGRLYLRGQLGRLGRVRRQDQPGRPRRLPHPARGVEPGRDGEADVIEIQAFSGETGSLEQGRQAGAPPRSQPLEPQTAMERFSPRIGATSATVPMRARSASSRTIGGSVRSAAGTPPPPVPRSADARPSRPRLPRSAAAPGRGCPRVPG